MNPKSLFAGLAAATALTMAAPASAYIVLDGWQLETTTDIGHLNLSGGNQTVVQEVDGSGNPFAGAAFTETGTIFSISYTKENVVGAGDFGFPQSFGTNIGYRLVTSDLSGVVVGFSATTGATAYLFTGGTLNFQKTTDAGTTWSSLANLSVVMPSGGALNDFFGAAQTNGQSTITGLFQVAGYTPGLLKDSLGNVLDPNLGLLFDIETNNTISSPVVSVPCNGVGSTGFCAQLQVNNDGSVDLLKVPEPATLALAGIALLGLGATARRRKS